MGIAVPQASGASAWIGFPNTGDGSPEVPIIFRIPARDAGVGHRDVDLGKEASQLNRLQVGVIRDLDGDLIIKAWWRAEARDAVICPEDADEALPGRTRGPSNDAVAAKRFCFAIRLGIFAAG